MPRVKVFHSKDAFRLGVRQITLAENARRFLKFVKSKMDNTRTYIQELK